MKTKSFLTITAVMLGGTFFALAQATETPAAQNGKKARGYGPPSEKILAEFDKDGDGKLSPEEREALKASRKAKFEAMRKAWIAKYDVDGDGKLNETERAVAREARKAKLLEKFDKDGDGKLSKEEKAAMPKAKVKRPLAKKGACKGKPGKAKKPAPTPTPTVD